MDQQNNKILLIGSVRKKEMVGRYSEVILLIKRTTCVNFQSCLPVDFHFVEMRNNKKGHKRKLSFQSCENLGRVKLSPWNFFQTEVAKKKTSKGFKQTPGGGCDAGLVVSVQVEAVQLIADGKAPRIPQTEEGASYEGIQRKSNAKVRAPGTLPNSVFEAAGYFLFFFCICWLF